MAFLFHRWFKIATYTHDIHIYIWTCIYNISYLYIHINIHHTHCTYKANEGYVQDNQENLRSLGVDIDIAWRAMDGSRWQDGHRGTALLAMLRWVMDPNQAGSGHTTNGTTYEGFLIWKDPEVGFETHISKKIKRYLVAKMEIWTLSPIYRFAECSQMVLKDLLEGWTSMARWVGFWGQYLRDCPTVMRNKMNWDERSMFSRYRQIILRLMLAQALKGYKLSLDMDPEWFLVRSPALWMDRGPWARNAWKRRNHGGQAAEICTFGRQNHRVKKWAVWQTLLI